MAEEHTKTVHEETMKTHFTVAGSSSDDKADEPEIPGAAVPLNQPGQNVASRAPGGNMTASKPLKHESSVSPSTPTASDSSERENGAHTYYLGKRSKARKAHKLPNRGIQTGLHIQGGTFSINNGVPTMDFPPGSVQLGGVPLTHKEALENFSESSTSTSTSTSVPVPVSPRGPDGIGGNRPRIQEAHLFRNMKGMVIDGGEFSVNSGYGYRSGFVANLIQNAYTHPLSGGGGGGGTPAPDLGFWAAHSINDVSRMTQTINKYVDLHLTTRKNRNRNKKSAAGSSRGRGNHTDSGDSNDARERGPRPNVNTGRNELISQIQEMGILRGCNPDEFTITNAKFFVNGREV